MTIKPHDIGTFLVSSQSRDIEHLVDLQYIEEGHSKPRCAWGCESNLIYGRVCPHILAVVAMELERLGI